MPIRAILAALIVALCWGGNFTATKFALQDFPPYFLIFIRFIGVSLLLAPFAARLPRPNLRDMLVIGILLIVMQFAFIFLAMAMGLTITSAIIATQMGVPFSCVVSAVMFKDYLGPWRSAGLMIAFLGVMVVAGTPNAAQHPLAFFLGVLAAISWSCANIYMKRLPPQPVVTLLFWPGLFALPFLAALSAIFEQGQFVSLQSAHWSSWVGITYSALFSSLTGYGLWNWLLNRYPLSQVVPYTLCVPIFGITAGIIFFHEPMTLQILLGAGMTIFGVGIITLRRPKLAELADAA